MAVRACADPALATSTSLASLQAPPGRQNEILKEGKQRSLSALSSVTPRTHTRPNTAMQTHGCRTGLHAPRSHHHHSALEGGKKGRSLQSPARWQGHGEPTHCLSTSLDLRATVSGGAPAHDPPHAAQSTGGRAPPSPPPPTGDRWTEKTALLVSSQPAAGPEQCWEDERLPHHHGERKPRSPCPHSKGLAGEHVQQTPQLRTRNTRRVLAAGTRTAAAPRPTGSPQSTNADHPNRPTPEAETHPVRARAHEVERRPAGDQRHDSRSHGTSPQGAAAAAAEQRKSKARGTQGAPGPAAPQTNTQPAAGGGANPGRSPHSPEKAQTHRNAHSRRRGVRREPQRTPAARAAEHWQAATALGGAPRRPADHPHTKFAALSTAAEPTHKAPVSAPVCAPQATDTGEEEGRREGTSGQPGGRRGPASRPLARRPLHRRNRTHRRQSNHDTAPARAHTTRADQPPTTTTRHDTRTKRTKKEGRPRRQKRAQSRSVWLA